MANYHRRIRRTRYRGLTRANAISFARHLRCKCEPHNVVRHVLTDTGHSPWPYRCLQCGSLKQREHNTKSERGGTVTVSIATPFEKQVVRAHGGYRVGGERNGARGWFRWLPLTEVQARIRQGELIKVVRE